MKKKILILVLLSCYNLATSQIQNNFFVEDANGVDYVRFKLCVNNDAKIYSAEVIESESTYNNKHVINQLKKYFLSVEFYPNSKLKNDCFETTSTLINSKYENIKAEDVKIETNEFLRGKYRYKNPFYRKTKIKRSKKIQREIGVADKQIYFIKWLSNTRYTLVYKRMTEKSLKKFIGKEIRVEILDVLPDNSYVYKSTTNHFDWVTYGVIQKIK